MKTIFKIFALLLGLASGHMFGHLYHETKRYDQVGYCCYRDEGFYNEHNTIRWDNDFANEWPRYGVTNEGKVSFPDLSEQSLISGFERGTYNTPK